MLEFLLNKKVRKKCGKSAEKVRKKFCKTYFEIDVKLASEQNKMNVFYIRLI